MIYFVAFGGGLKCPRKIHLNTQWGGGEEKLDRRPFSRPPHTRWGTRRNLKSYECHSGCFGYDIVQKILRALCQLNSWNNAAICDRLIPRCHDGLATAGPLRQARQARFGPWGRILDLAWFKLAVVALYCHYVGCIIWTVSSSWYLFVRPSYIAFGRFRFSKS